MVDIFGFFYLPQFNVFSVNNFNNVFFGDVGRPGSDAASTHRRHPRPSRPPPPLGDHFAIESMCSCGVYSSRFFRRPQAAPDPVAPPAALREVRRSGRPRGPAGQCQPRRDRGRRELRRLCGVRQPPSPTVPRTPEAVTEASRAAKGDRTLRCCSSSTDRGDGGPLAVARGIPPVPRHRHRPRRRPLLAHRPQRITTRDLRPGRAEGGGGADAPSPPAHRIPDGSPPLATVPFTRGVSNLRLQPGHCHRPRPRRSIMV